MIRRIRILTLTAWMTTVLLAISALLIGVGMFDDYLDWDIFSERLQKILQGVFAACVAIGAFGGGITVVLGIHQSVQSLRRLEGRLAGGGGEEPDAPRSRYLMCAILVIVGFFALIGSLAAVNHRVQIHRSQVFKRIAAEQLAKLDGRFVGVLSALAGPPRDHVPRALHDLVRTLDEQGYIQCTTLYVPDPNDPAAMWGYTARDEYRDCDGFARFFVAKDFEKAMQASCAGDRAALDGINGARAAFSWYHVVSGEGGGPLGIVRVDANRRENFREYDMF